MSYSADRAAAVRLAASYVVKILNGAKPADLPVEQPTKQPQNGARDGPRHLADSTRPRRRGDRMRRREFIALLGGAAVGRPLAARAQQPERIRRIGVLTQGSIHTHPSSAFRAFLSALLTLGWEDGRNLKI
jgi:hypothetical protein